MSRFGNISTVTGSFAAILAMASVGHSAVVFTEPFNNLSAWTVLDSDGAGTNAKVEAVGGKLHVIDNDPVVDVDDHGLYAGQQAPLAGGRMYVWGLNNTTGGFVGNVNLSSATGLKHGSDTPIGDYIRWNSLPQFVRWIDNSNPSPPAAYTAATDYDLMTDYDGSNVSFFYKLSTDSTWTQIGSTAGYTAPGGNFFLNITSLGSVFTGNAVNSEWYINQLDITDLNHDILTSPVPEPAIASLAGIGALALIGRRRRV